MQGRERAAALAGRKVKRALDVILAIDLTIWKFEMKLVFALDYRDGKIQVQLNGDGERVETWPEIGNRRWNANL